jgi:hypothetical protein
VLPRQDQLVEVDDDRDVRLDPTPARQLARTGRDGQYVDQRVGVAFTAGARVALAVDGLVRFRACLDEGLEQFGVLGSQSAAEPHTAVFLRQLQCLLLAGGILARFRAVGVQDVADLDTQRPQVAG